MREVYRSELIKIAEKMELADPNDYVMQVMRTYPDLEIIDDLKIKK